MANRRFNQFRLSLEKSVVDLFGKVAIGGTGAPTLSTLNSKGISTIARNGVGKYTITLQDTYQRLLKFSAIVQNTTGISASPNVGIISAGVNTAGAPTIVIQFSTGGAATELTTGDTVYFAASLSNTTAI